MRPDRLVLLAILALTVAACTRFPEFDDPGLDAARAAPYPTLGPVEALTATVPPEDIKPDDAEEIADRVKRLQDRADSLRGTGIDPETRARMQRGVQPPASP